MKAHGRTRVKQTTGWAAVEGGARLARQVGTRSGQPVNARQCWDFILLAMGSHQRFLSMSMACSNLCSEIPLSTEEGGMAVGGGVCSPGAWEPAIVAVVSRTG